VRGPEFASPAHQQSLAGANGPSSEDDQAFIDARSRREE